MHSQNSVAQTTLEISLQQIEKARSRIKNHVLLTPLARSETLSALTGCDLTLKFENQQFTASFKERGAVNKLLQLSKEECQRGVVAASAGNHSQALARHGSLLGIPTQVVMPKYTPNTKVENTRIFGAEVILQGEKFDDSMAYAIGLSKEQQKTLIHPFDDLDIIAGQGTLGLEMLQQDPTIETVIVPIGGGGLISGVASAFKQVKPKVKVIGVQVNTFNTAYAMFHNVSPTEKPTAATIAEGIAVKRPGDTTGPMMMNLVDEVVEVSEQQIEAAVFTLLEIEKTVSEGAGAASLAAVMSHAHLVKGRTAVLITGGNIEMMVLANVLQRGLVRTKRLVRIRVYIADVPGALGKLAEYLGKLDSNIVDINHLRTMHTSTIGAQPLDILLQLCGEEQADLVVHELREHGYEVETLEN